MTLRKAVLQQKDWQFQSNLMKAIFFFQRKFSLIYWRAYIKEVSRQSFRVK